MKASDATEPCVTAMGALVAAVNPLAEAMSV